MPRFIAGLLMLAIAVAGVGGCKRGGRAGVEVQSASRVVFTVPKRFRTGDCQVTATILHGARYAGKDRGEVWTMRRPDDISTPCPAQIVFPEGLVGYSTSGTVGPLPPGDYSIWIDGVGGLLTNGFTVSG